jgi:hypothetical protein
MNYIRLNSSVNNISKTNNFSGVIIIKTVIMLFNYRIEPAKTTSHTNGPKQKQYY